jgi:hypothetical protein
LGNIGVQIKAFDESTDLKRIRRVIEKSVPVTEYSEAESGAELIERYRKLP